MPIENDIPPIRDKPIIDETFDIDITEQLYMILNNDNSQETLEVITSKVDMASAVSNATTSNESHKCISLWERFRRARLEFYMWRCEVKNSIVQCTRCMGCFKTFCAIFTVISVICGFAAYITVVMIYCDRCRNGGKE